MSTTSRGGPSATHACPVSTIFLTWSASAPDELRRLHRQLLNLPMADCTPWTSASSPASRS